MYKTIFEKINERIILNKFPSFTTSLEEIESENEFNSFYNGIIEPFNKFPLINIFDESQDIPILAWNESKEKKFIIKIKKNPGRKPEFLKIKRKKIHDKYSEDNIIRKIICHSSNFIRNFINEILHNLGFKQQFFDIDYKIKINKSKKTINELKTYSIGDILRQKISPKYIKNSKDEEKNLKIFNEVTQNNIIKKILEENYLKLFENIYYKNKKIINLINYGLNTNIILSNKVKTFEDLLKKKNDAVYKKKLNQVVLKIFCQN